jgi:ribonuclease-3
MSRELSQILGYVFHDPKLLKTALTHRSKAGDHNERLEFLGDGVVNFVIAELLYQRFPAATEGELSRWRATLVNRNTLADLAREFELGHHILLGPGELRSGGHKRYSILSCAMEAVIGAIYLDGGFTAVYKCISVWYALLLQSLSDASDHKDPKTVLQEYLQSHHLPLPVYAVEKTEGEAHQQTFIVSCQVAHVSERVLGKGTSRRRAEQDAAQAMLVILRKSNHD